MKTIGVIGVGNMGLPMLKALRRAGFDVVARDLRPAAGAAALADKRFRISARPGDGARMKLVNNLLAGINLAVGAEVLAMGQHLGLDPQLMLAQWSAPVPGRAGSSMSACRAPLPATSRRAPTPASCTRT